MARAREASEAATAAQAAAAAAAAAAAKELDEAEAVHAKAEAEAAAAAAAAEAVREKAEAEKAVEDARAARRAADAAERRREIETKREKQLKAGEIRARTIEADKAVYRLLSKKTTRNEPLKRSGGDSGGGGESLTKVIASPFVLEQRKRETIERAKQAGKPQLGKPQQVPVPEKDSGATTAAAGTAAAAEVEQALSKVLQELYPSQDGVRGQVVGEALLSVGVATVDGACRLSDADMIAAGVKKGPRMVLLNWARAKRPAGFVDDGNTRSDRGGGCGGALSSPSSPVRIGLGMSLGVPRQLDGALARVLTDLYSHRDASLAQLIGDALLKAGITSVDEARHVNEAQLAEAGVKKGPRMSLMKWAQKLRQDPA